MMKTQKDENGNRRPLSVLFVEDSPLDAELLQRALAKGGFALTSQRVDTHESMESALKHSWDVVLADHSMPQFSAPEALALLQQHGLDVPFIIVSGHIEEETAVAAMRAGAHDYIMKERLARLVPAVERELREAQVRAAQRQSEEELRRAHEELEVRVEQRTADLKAAYVQLEKVLAERRRLENELLEIAENERRRIGFDLHDDLGQKLTGLSLLARGLSRRLTNEKHPSADDAGKVCDLIDEVISHTHNLARQFSSINVCGEDLTANLKSLAENVEKMFGIPCVCTVKGTVPDLPENTVMQLYKIAQEAVSNAIKHGKAKRVNVGLAHGQNQLTLVIRNDGMPFAEPVDPKSRRLGLKIMNYRASTIGAILSIQPQEKSGTVVTCHFAVKNGSPETEPVRTEAARAAAEASLRKPTLLRQPGEHISITTASKHPLNAKPA